MNRSPAEKAIADPDSQESCGFGRISQYANDRREEDQNHRKGD